MSTEVIEVPAAGPSSADATLVPQSGGANCGCGGAAAAQPQNGSAVMSPSYVYALGRVMPRFPRLSVEKEFAQATGRADTTGLTDRQALREVLSKRENRYLARQMCWVFTVEGLDTYILLPRDPADFDQLLESLRGQPGPLDLDLVVGQRGPLAPADFCNGLTVPIVVFDQLYSFDRESLVNAIPKPAAGDKNGQFTAAAEELFDRVMQMADNAGSTDEHRALNYLLVRYPAIYATVAERHSQASSLTGVDVRPSTLSGVRRIVDIVLSFTNRNTDVTEKSYVRVDVTEEFPFLVTKLSPYYDR